MSLTFGFFHVAVMGHWKEVNKELFDSMLKSGLLHGTIFLKIGLVGDTKNFTVPYSMSTTFRFEELGGLEEYEYATQQLMWKECQKYSNPEWKKNMGIAEEIYVYYLCNAGVSHPPTHDHYPEWRHLMSHYNFDKWEECVSKLDEGYDTVGVEWQTDPVPHWSGNFWWANSRYIATLPSPESMKNFDAGGGISAKTHPRHGAEWWIGMNDPKHYSLFQTGYSWRDRPRKDWLNG